MTAARVVVTSAELAQVLVEDGSGRWRPLLTVEGPDAADRAEAARALVEAGEGIPVGFGRRPAGGGWVVRLPDALRAPFEALAAAHGGTPEAQITRYLEDALELAAALARPTPDGGYAGAIELAAALARPTPDGGYAGAMKRAAERETDVLERD